MPTTDLPFLQLAPGTELIVAVVGSIDDDTLTVVVGVREVGVAMATQAPNVVNTGSPIGGSLDLRLIAMACAGLALAAGSWVALRRTA